MSIAQLHCVGRGHEARFSEDFDQAFANALQTSPEPSQAETELDDVALLTVLANFAGPGSYDPSSATQGHPSPMLDTDLADPALRIFRWHWWWAGAPVGRFAFTGRALTSSQTVVFRIRFEPARPAGATR